MNIVEMALHKEEETNPTKYKWTVVLADNVKYTGHIENLFSGNFRLGPAPYIYFDATRVLWLSRA